MRSFLTKDHLAALLMVALGAAVVALGATYRMGSLGQMDAGFMPVVLGTLMIAAGVAIGATAARRPARSSDEPAGARLRATVRAYGRGWTCVAASVVAFVVLGRYGGLLTATFGSVFVAAMGDRDGTLRSSALLALAAVAFCTLVFHFGLKLQLPLFAWR